MTYHSNKSNCITRKYMQLMETNKQKKHLLRLNTLTTIKTIPHFFFFLKEKSI